jgi:GNAT superfamily N-acetyltransferase
MIITARPADPRDADAVLRLLRQLAAFEGAPDGLCLDHDALMRDAFGERPRFVALLAERDGVAIGVAVVFLGYSTWAARPTLVIHDLFVAEHARGAGAGHALVAAAMEMAAREGCCRVDLDVLDWNEPAKEFYRRMGFAVLEEWRKCRLGLS